MGVQQFEEFNLYCWDQIKDHLNDDKLIKIKLGSRKHGGTYRSKPYYTFIGKDARNAIKIYLRDKHRPMKEIEVTYNGKKIRSTPIFLGRQGNPILYSALAGYLRRQAERASLYKSVTPACPKCGGETWTDYKAYHCNNCEEVIP